MSQHTDPNDRRDPIHDDARGRIIMGWDRQLKEHARRHMGRPCIAIVGSRAADVALLEQVSRFVDNLPANTVVISGGAAGVDREAEWAALERGLDVVIFRVTSSAWESSLGRRAGIIRNNYIVDASDGVVAFQSGASKGTAYTVKRARSQGLPVWVYRA